MSTDIFIQCEKLEKENTDLREKLAALEGELEETSACCAEMRAALESSKHENLGHRCSDGWFIARDHALSSDCGKGWISLEVGKMLVEALEEVIDKMGRYCGDLQQPGSPLGRWQQALAKAKEVLK